MEARSEFIYYIERIIKSLPPELLLKGFLNLSVKAEIFTQIQYLSTLCELNKTNLKKYAMAVLI